MTLHKIMLLNVVTKNIKIYKCGCIPTNTRQSLKLDHNPLYHINPLDYIHSLDHLDHNPSYLNEPSGYMLQFYPYTHFLICIL